MTLFKKIPVYVYVMFFVSFIFMSGFLLNPGLSLVDDGYSLLIGKKLLSNISFENWSNLLIEQDIGRIRPIYLLYFSSIYLLFGYSSIGLWIGQFLTIFVSLVLFYRILNIFSKSSKLSYILTFFWLIIPTVAENIFRLGTAEPRQFLFILGFLNIFYSKNIKYKNVLLVILFFLAVGTKETSIMLIPFIIYNFLSKKIVKINSGLIFFFISFIVPLILITAFLLMRKVLPSGYAADHFNIDILFLLKSFKNILNSFKFYSLILYISFISIFLRFLYFSLREKISSVLNNSIIEFSLILLIVQSIFFIAAWSFQFERYFYLLWSFLILFISKEVFNWKKIKINKLSLNQLYVFLCFTLGLISIFLSIFIKKDIRSFIELPNTSFTIYKRAYDSVQITNSIVSYLLNHDFEEIYLLHNGYEVSYEIGIYASKFESKNIRVYGNNQDFFSDGLSKEYVFVENPELEYYKSKSNNKIMLGTNFEIENILLDDTKENYKLLNLNTKYNIVDEKNLWWVR